MKKQQPLVRLLSICLVFGFITFTSVHGQEFAECRIETFAHLQHYKQIPTPLNGLEFGENWRSLARGAYSNTPSGNAWIVWFFSEDYGEITLLECDLYFGLYYASRVDLELVAYDIGGHIIGSDEGAANFSGGFRVWDYLEVNAFPNIIDHVRIYGASRRIIIDNVIRCSSIKVDIDIKPGGDPNAINLRSNGVLPVVVLGSSTFDVTEVDPSTVLFAGAAPQQKGKSGHTGSFEDVNTDGYLDLILHFQTKDLDLSPSDIDASLTGQMVNGASFMGTDDVRIVPPGSSKQLEPVETTGDTFALYPAYPNPFNPTTTLSFYVPEVSHVQLVIYDQLGREVQRLVEGIRSAGTHRVRFEAADLPSGMYMYRLEAGGFVETKLIMLVKL